MQSDIDSIIYKIVESNDRSAIDSVITDYIPFVLKTVSEANNRYITENDEEFSIGLRGFHEAMIRYRKEMGHFLPFAKLVIFSRLKNYWKKESRHAEQSFETVKDSYELIDTGFDEISLRQEIEILSNELADYKLDFDILAERMPRHRDTKNRAIELADRILNDDELLSVMQIKKKIPIPATALKYTVSPRILRKSEAFITAVILIKKNELNDLYEWIRKKDYPKV